MLNPNETWRIDTSNESDVPVTATLELDSTGIVPTVKVNGSNWGTWNGSSSPYALKRDSDGQDFQLYFTPGTQGGQDKLACYIVVANNSASLGPGHGSLQTTFAEVQGSSWTAQGGQGGTGGSPCVPMDCPASYPVVA